MKASKNESISKKKQELKNSYEKKRQMELENKKKIKKPSDPIDRDSFDSFPASDPATKY